MPKKPQWIVLSLNVLGWVGLATGIATGLYSCFELAPRIEGFIEQVKKNLDTLGQVTLTLDQGTPALLSTLEIVQQSIPIVKLFPTTLISLRGTLLQASSTLDASAVTALQVQEGLPGMVLPTNALSLDQTLLRKTATQLKLLGGMVEELHIASLPLTRSMARLSGRMIRLESNLRSTPDPFQNTRNGILGIQQALDNLSLPMHTVLAGVGVASIYLFLGLFSFTLAAIYEQIMAPGEKVRQALSDRARDRERPAA